MAETASEIKLFGKWTYDDVEVNDISLEDYIAVKGKHSVYLPHTAGRYQKKRFRKAQCPIVERLVCAMMRYGRNNGKKLMAVRIVKHAMEMIRNDHCCTVWSRRPRMRWCWCTRVSLASPQRATQ